jgi:hypothetical protein
LVADRRRDGRAQGQGFVPKPLADGVPPPGTLQTLVATLHPGPSQAQLLLRTMAVCNRAANDVADVAYALGRAHHAELSKLLYNDLRLRYRLPANLALHAITKLVQRFHLDPSRRPHFADHAGVFYQEGKTLSWKGADRISMLTLEGRQLVPVRFERYQELGLPTFKRGNVGLTYDDPVFAIFQVVEVPDAPPARLPTGGDLRARFTGC